MRRFTFFFSLMFLCAIPSCGTAADTESTTCRYEGACEVQGATMCGGAYTCCRGDYGNLAWVKGTCASPVPTPVPTPTAGLAIHWTAPAGMSAGTATVVGGYPGVSKWSVADPLCVMSASGSERVCSLPSVPHGVTLTFTIQVKNPAGDDGVSWVFDRCSHPGAGYGGDVGVTAVTWNGSNLGFGLVGNGYLPCTYNAVITVP